MVKPMCIGGCGNYVCAYMPQDPHCHSECCVAELEVDDECFSAEESYKLNN